MENKTEYLAIFNEEAGDLLREWEECLLALDENPAQPERLNGVFRAVHTLKGSAGFIGFDMLQKLAHSLESSLADVRDGRRVYDARLGEVLFEGLDLCKSMVASADGGADLRDQTEAFLLRLRAPATEEEPTRGPTTALPAVPALANATRSSCRLEIRIEGQTHEAYLRSFLVKARLDRLGRLVNAEPSPETLRDGDGPFIYTVTVESEAGPEAIAAGVAVDQVIVRPLTSAEATPVITPPVPAAAPGRDLVVTQSEEVVRVSWKSWIRCSILSESWSSIMRDSPRPHTHFGRHMERARSLPSWKKRPRVCPPSRGSFRAAS